MRPQYLVRLLSMLVLLSNFISYHAYSAPLCGGSSIPLTLSGAWRPYTIQDTDTLLFDTGSNFSWLYPNIFTHLTDSPVSVHVQNFTATFYVREPGGTFEDSPTLITRGIIGNDFTSLGGVSIELDYSPGPRSFTIGTHCDYSSMLKAGYVQYRQDNPLAKAAHDAAPGMPVILAKIDDIGPIPVLIDTGFAEYDHIGKVVINKAMLDYLNNHGLHYTSGPGMSVTNCDADTTNNTPTFAIHRFSLINPTTEQPETSFSDVLLNHWTKNDCVSFMSDTAPPLAMIGPAYLYGLQSIVFDSDSVWIKKGDGLLPGSNRTAIAIANATADKTQFETSEADTLEHAQAEALAKCNAAHGACEIGGWADRTQFNCLAMSSREDKLVFVEFSRSIDHAEWKSLQTCHGPQTSTKLFRCTVVFAKCNDPAFSADMLPANDAPGVAPLPPELK